MTEALWLADFVTRFDLPSPVKKHILKRIKDLDAKPVPTQAKVNAQVSVPANLPPHIANQSPSTIANFLKKGIAGNVPGSCDADQQLLAQAEQPPQPAGIVIASQTAANAIADRQKAISAALSGKPEPGRTSPRKF